MAMLFSPLRLGRLTLQNRIVLAPLPSGAADPGGQLTPGQQDYYLARARGGAGLILLEACWMQPPAGDPPPHLGLYHDDQAAPLRELAGAIEAAGSRLMAVIDQPLVIDPGDRGALAALVADCVAAARRARLAGCAGVIFSGANGGPLHQLLSPLHSQTPEMPTLGERLRVPLAIVEGVRAQLGGMLVLGFRLAIEELQPHGLTLQDVRVIAKRLTAAGADLLDIAVLDDGTAPIARFPGWRVPLAAAVRRVVEVPVMAGGGLYDAVLADSLVRDGSIDLVMIGRALRDDPDWPRAARRLLDA